MSDLTSMTVAELKELADKESIDLGDARLKADIIAAIEKAQGTSSDADSGDDEAPEKELEVVEQDYVVKIKPELTEDEKAALELRDAKQRANPEFRRQEWFRYKKLGGKDAGWRRPRGIHSKMRRHFKYRPPVVSIGYRTPAAARGLHPSGFEEVLVYRPDDLAEIDPKKQAARIGRTVGGRKTEAIVSKADEMGIRVLNRGGN